MAGSSGNYRSLYRSVVDTNFGSRNDVSLHHFVHDFDAVDDDAIHRIVVVEANIVRQVHENLAVAGVVTSGRKTDGATPMRQRPDLVSRKRGVP